MNFPVWGCKEREKKSGIISSNIISKLALFTISNFFFLCKLCGYQIHIIYTGTCRQTTINSFKQSFLGKMEEVID